MFWLKNKVDIYCKKGICPICEGKMIFYETDYINSYECKNKCYKYYPWYPINGNSFERFEFFEEDVHLIEIGIILNYFYNRKKVIDKIRYWKNEERYLIKILLEV